MEGPPSNAGGLLMQEELSKWIEIDEEHHAWPYKISISADYDLSIVRPDMKIYKHLRGTYAARYPTLGLTAYGDEKSEAKVNLVELFSYAMHSYKEKGFLEEHLEHMGVENYREKKET